MSQDGKFDFPYEKVCLEVSDSGKIFAQGDIWGEEENYIEVARYESEAKARKAVEMLRKAYSPLVVIKDLGDEVVPDIKPNDWRIGTPEPLNRNNFYFQFPQDSEVEV